jgi:MFS family permease
MTESKLSSSPDFAKLSSNPDGKDVESLEKTSIEKQALATSEDASLYIIDRHAEKSLVWKFDTRILPVLAIMYLFNSLDKSNLGNAKTAGLVETLNLIGDQYNIILSVFFVPYVLTAPFLAILGKKFGPSRVLPLMMLCFGFVTTMVVAVKNFGGLMAIRWFLGMAESAFFPLVIYYQTT